MALRTRTLLALLLFLGVAPLRAASAPEANEIPEENSSTVSEDDRFVRESFESAEEAIRKRDWNTAVRRLQTVIDADRVPQAPLRPQPWVLPVRGRSVYEGAWLVARHRIARGGDAALVAYASEYGPVAGEQLARAGRTRDVRGLEQVATRFLPLPQARQAVLALADLALEAGDRDRALGWLDMLEDVEAVSGGGPEAWAAWRAARQARAAAALARPGHQAEARRHLEAIQAPGAPAKQRYSPIPAEASAPAEAPTGWPTLGGQAARNAVPSALGADFALAWFNSFESAALHGDVSRSHPRDRPSTWHPPGCVTDGETAFAFDGQRVYAFDVRTGRRRAAPYPIAREGFEPLWRPGKHEARDELGLLEGHALTLGPRTETGRLLYVAAPDPYAEASGWGYDEPRDDHLVALLFDGTGFRTVFDVGGGKPFASDASDDTRIYGSPLVYQGRLWVSAIRPTASASDQAEAWLLALDPRTGETRIETYLGLGPPVRRGRADEAIPSSPAAARGRVVVSTSLGIVAAVDAHDGRPQWLLRYERGAVAHGRSRRLGALRDTAPRLSGFRNQPPVIALERTFVAPTDGPHLLCLFTRPRGPGRELVSWRLHRRLDFRDFAAEQIVAVQEGGATQPPRLILAGRGRSTEGDVPAPIAVALDALHPPRILWTATATTGDGGEPYGTAAATAEELFVPTAHGISVYATRDGRDLATLDVSGLSPQWAELLPPESLPYGNVVLVPGRGFLTVSDALIAFWRR